MILSLRIEKFISIIAMHKKIYKSNYNTRGKDNLFKTNNFIAACFYQHLNRQPTTFVCILIMTLSLKPHTRKTEIRNYTFARSTDDHIFQGSGPILNKYEIANSRYPN